MIVSLPRKSKERYVRILTLMKPYTYSLAGLADEDDDPQSSDEEDTKDQQIGKEAAQHDSVTTYNLYQFMKYLRVTSAWLISLRYSDLPNWSSHFPG